MFLHHETYAVNLGYQNELEQRVARLHLMQAKAPGYAGSEFYRYAGNTETYIALRFWNERADAQAYAQTEEFKTYLRNRPPDGYARQPEMEYYELAHHGRGAGNANLGVLVQFDTLPGQHRAWEQAEIEFAPVFQAAPGFHSIRLFRYLGGPTRFLRVALWESRTALQAFLESPERSEYQRNAPKGLLRTPSTHRLCDILQRLPEP